MIHQEPHQKFRFYKHTRCMACPSQSFPKHIARFLCTHTIHQYRDTRGQVFSYCFSKQIINDDLCGWLGTVQYMQAVCFAFLSVNWHLNDHDMTYRHFLNGPLNTQSTASSCFNCLPAVDLKNVCGPDHQTTIIQPSHKHHTNIIHTHSQNTSPSCWPIYWYLSRT